MNEKNKVTIFHLFRKDGTALFLHPFTSVEKMLEILEDHHIHARYGSEPRVESLTVFRNDLHNMIEKGVRTWLAEKRFIPRFIISSLVFLAVYLLSSLLIRDIIPVVDEIILGLGGGIATFFLLRRKDMKSTLAQQKRTELRDKVDHILFEEDEFVKQVEGMLHHFELESSEGILKSVLLSEEAMNIPDPQEARELMAYMESRLNMREVRKKEKLLTKVSSESDTDQGISNLVRWAEIQKVDLSLFATYLKIKKSCGVY